MALDPALEPMRTPVTLSGRAVRLEPLAERHLADLAVAGGDREPWTWLFDDHSTPASLERWLADALRKAAAGAELPFATIDIASGRAIGSTRFMALAPEHRRLEIGWTWLGPSWRGGAHNSEAKLLMLEHAFERLGCGRVELKTDALNARSRGGLEAIGARSEGVFRHHMIMTNGRVRDSAWYAIVAEEWPGVRERLRARVDARLPGA